MIKVLLVDDEKLERVLIRKGFDWESQGFEIIGEVGSAKDALEFIEHRKPDLILTDINMPQMDGLELTEQVVKKIPECHIVIVTGYREFDYAKKALQLGVEDFLLKPVNMRDIENVTNSIKSKIKEKQSREEEIEEWKNSLLIDKDIVMESFFQRLVENRVDEEEARKKLEIYNCIELLKDCICVNIHINTTNTENEEEQIQTVLNHIKKEGKAYCNTLCFVHYMKDIVVYFMGKTEEESIYISNRFVEEIRKESDLEVVLGISKRKTGFAGVAKAYKEAKQALNTALFLGSNPVLTYEGYCKILEKDNNKDNAMHKGFEWDEFTFAITNGLVEKVEQYILSYVEEIKESGVVDKEYLGLMSMNMMSNVELLLNKQGQTISKILGNQTVYDEVKHFKSVLDVGQYLKKHIIAIMQDLEQRKTKQMNKTVAEALAYAEKEMFNPELSLKTVAANIYSNESYLSRIFKKEMGLSLIEYITKKRIEESIRLLNNTDLKVYEIAESIGFRDSHYFSICFKKHTGVTVKEFKKDKF